MKKIALFILIWLLLSSVGYMIASSFINSSEMQEFADKGVAVYGNVTAKDPQNHASVHYSYNVAGKQYKGIGGAERGNDRFDQIEIGQKIVVFYKPDAPNESMSGYPQYYLNSNKFIINVFIIVFPIFPMLIIIFIYFIISKANRNLA